MFKKFLAAVVMMAVFTASAAFAEPPVPPVGGILTNFSVDPSTVDPSKDENVTVSFKLNEAVKVQAYVSTESNPPQIVKEFDNFTTGTENGTVTYTWDLKDPQGNVVSNGEYEVKVFVEKDGQIVGAESESKLLTVNNTNVPTVTGLTIKPTSFSPEKLQETIIAFEVTKNAYLTVVVKKGAEVVRSFDDYNGNDFYSSTEKHSISWNGKNNQGVNVEAGVYTVEVTAKLDNLQSTATATVTVEPKGQVSKGVIKNVELDPSQEWDPTEQELEISFELLSEVKFLNIEAKQGNKVIEVLDDEFADDDDYEETWDGTDEDGDYVAPGVWTITIRADGDEVSQKINVSYEQPNFVEAFVTKDSFDPSEDEFIYLVFKVNTTSEVDVDVFQGTKKVENLINDETVSKNRWYAVKFDGMDEGEEVDFTNDWKFKISAENETDNDIKANTSVEFDVEEDDVSDKKSNATNDYVDPVIFDDEEDDSVTINYTIDEEADVFLAVYEGKSTGGNAEVELMDYVDQDAGEHTVEWNARDEKNKELKDGIYTYKMITRTSSGQKDTEIGRFVIGNLGDYDAPEPTPGPKPTTPKPEKPTPTPATCGMYSDTQFIEKNNYEMCLAIEWATEMGIFEGYVDGSFGPNNDISRAEVLKVVFEAFEENVIMLPNDGSNQGFSDVDSNAWYMPYVRTAKFYGMLQGYNDGTARLGNDVSRSEFLKFVLEASESFTGYVVPKYSFSYFADVNYTDANQAWYRDYAGVAYDLFLFDFYDQDTYSYGQPIWLKPAQPVTRGEVALALYRMYNGGLLGYYDEVMTGSVY